MKIEYNKNNVINFEELEIGDCFRVKNNSTMTYMKLIQNYHIRVDDWYCDVNTICLDGNNLVFFSGDCEVIKVDYSICIND